MPHPLTEILKDKTVLIAGCGGLGGNVAEYLGRMGVGRIILLDGDRFEPSNMNRQLYCTVETIGALKAETAGKRMGLIGTSKAVYIAERFPTEKLDAYNGSIDAVIDCLDNVKSRILLEEYAGKWNIPLIHGAINGMVGQVTTVLPGMKTLAKLYGGEDIKIGVTMAFVPSFFASIEAAETVKVLNGKPSLAGKLLLVDLETLRFNTLIL